MTTLAPTTLSDPTTFKQRWVDGLCAAYSRTVRKAPDAFEGIVQPELFLADALGGAGKPMLRVHTAGSVGGSTFIVGSHLIESGIHERVLAVAWEKQSEGNAQWGLAGGRSRGIGAGGAFAPWIRAYIEHRLSREAQIMARLKEGPQKIPQMVARNYADTPLHLHAAAGRSMLAHLVQMVKEGRVKSDDGGAKIDSTYRL